MPKKIYRCDNPTCREYFKEGKNCPHCGSKEYHLFKFNEGLIIMNKEFAKCLIGFVEFNGNISHWLYVPRKRVKSMGKCARCKQEKKTEKYQGADLCEECTLEIFATQYGVRNKLRELNDLEAIAGLNESRT